MVSVLLIIFIISFFVLARSSTLLVSSVTGFARLFGMSEYAIAFILMSFATSVSELFVGISSAVGDISSLSMGNILGANLLNITLVIAIPTLIVGRIKIESKILRHNFWYIFFLSLFPFFLGFDGIISRGDGVILLLGFISYMWMIMGEKEYFSKVYNNIPFIGLLKKTIHDIWILLLGVLLLVGASAVLVWSGTALLEVFLLDSLLFGIIFVSIGTTLPEIVFGVRSVSSQHDSMAIGNALGSIAFNASFIIGVVAIINPVRVDSLEELILVTVAFIVAFILFNILIYRGEEITRSKAVIFILIYILYVMTEFLIPDVIDSLFKNLI
ncbi:MAG: hypothetical protein COU46_01660 [Candidatus Niyogibacteria bacterium CG10_big_fil_rev_8_21_14_0_10_42_19]|uniref:Sodium/calcium exchanger membrane region domain-containing protein n=1 Tax=Candidatus Niyogibacteria bacterium CG10_big_fil_rev_8_21_14_0_10_42_19 TaxID=1974725 RepID=A0A2H0TFU5_9BACT|nr:MAG: hypothetical protein COU46_01660 [Candidatus Niyogibacteria bacterium CG10_big_fil_rev_8_21_14_0_10_42_19]